MTSIVVGSLQNEMVLKAYNEAYDTRFKELNARVNKPTCQATSNMECARA